MPSSVDSSVLAPPLSAVLLGAAAAVQAVRKGRSLTDALAETPPALRPAVQAISFHAMRQLGWADAVKRWCGARPDPCSTRCCGWR
ncbi:ribosomal RNA small subunit methyltransferase [Bordetella pertussis]|nr:ribosomal RNA small subunit methyltransferase [Bordetella pertussis]